MKTLHFVLMVFSFFSFCNVSFCQISVIDDSYNFFGHSFKYKNDVYFSKDGDLAKLDGQTLTTYKYYNNDYSFGNFMVEYSGLAYCIYSKTIAYSDDFYGETWALLSFDGNQLNLVKDGFDEIWEFIEYNDTLFFTELQEESWDQSFNLIKFDGENFHQVCKLGGNNSYGIMPVIFNDTLFFRIITQSGISHLAKYCNGITQIVNNPDEAQMYGGYSAEKPLIINDSLYIIYNNKHGVNQFAKYNNNQLELIDNPGNGQIYMVCSIQLKDTVYFNYRNEQGKFLLAYFDGKAIKLLPQYDDGLQMFTELVVFNDVLYFNCLNSKKQAQLLKIEENKIEVAAEIENAFSRLTDPIIAKNTLYFKIQTDISTCKLAKFDGGELKILENPDDNNGCRFPNFFVFNDTLFFHYNGKEGTLAFCGGEKVELIKDIPNGMTEGDFFEENNKLYFRYYYNLKDYIATFNYKSSEIISLAEDKKHIKNQPVAYPNPAGDKLHISNCENCSEITVVNTFGQPVLKKAFRENDTIDIESLPEGIFFIVIEKEDKSKTTQKILKIDY